MFEGIGCREVGVVYMYGCIHTMPAISTVPSSRLERMAGELRSSTEMTSPLREPTAAFASCAVSELDSGSPPPPPLPLERSPVRNGGLSTPVGVGGRERAWPSCTRLPKKRFMSAVTPIHIRGYNTNESNRQLEI